MVAMPSSVDAEPFETQGERRRAQLVAIAARLVIAGGSETVTHAAVAEHAGVGRTAVYHYFPTRDDLLAAVYSAFEEGWSQPVDTGAVTDGVGALLTGSPRRMSPAVRELFEQFWRAEDWTTPRLELRLAGIIIRRDVELFTRLLQRRPVTGSFEAADLTAPLAALGLTPVEIRVVTDTLLAVQYHVTGAALAGDVDRDEAVRLTYRMTLAAVRAYLD